MSIQSKRLEEFYNLYDTRDLSPFYRIKLFRVFIGEIFSPIILNRIITFVESFENMYVGLSKEVRFYMGLKPL